MLGGMLLDRPHPSIGSVEQLHDAIVAGLVKIVEELTNGAEVPRMVNSDELVGDPSQSGGPVRWGHRNGEKNPCRSLGPGDTACGTSG
jgi:hypothetical protein